LTIKEETIRDVDETFYKFNAGMNGFYRTNYPPERLAKLGAARAKLSVRDRVGLVGDAAALAVAGEGTTAGLLSLCAEFKDETSHL
jgi:aminopeptidase N